MKQPMKKAGELMNELKSDMEMYDLFIHLYIEEYDLDRIIEELNYYYGQHFTTQMPKYVDLYNSLENVEITWKLK